MSSGTRLFNYRQGDRSEYLALYLLSGLGLVTQVPRQEDIGFDFVCSITNQEVGRLTFNHQYLVSVKSKSSPSIELRPPKTDNETLDHISWLFRLELPLILGVVDKKACSISLYSTSPVWFIYYENTDCGSMTLIPRIDGKSDKHVDRPIKKEALKSAANRFHYEVDLGHPLVVLHERDLHDAKKLRPIKKHLRTELRLAQMTISHTRIGVPHFYWFAATKRDPSGNTHAYYYRDLPSDEELQNRVFAEVAPTLVSLALFYKQTANPLLEAVGKLLKQAPVIAVPDQVKQHLPKIYGA